MLRAIVLASLIGLAIAAPALAQECEMTTTRPDVDTGTPIARYYVDFDFCQPCGLIVGLLAPWVYEESNGIDGLQRGDEVYDDTCGGAAGRSDTIVF